MTRMNLTRRLGLASLGLAGVLGVGGCIPVTTDPVTTAGDVIKEMSGYHSETSGAKKEKLEQDKLDLEKRRVEALEKQNQGYNPAQNNDNTQNMTNESEGVLLYHESNNSWGYFPPERTGVWVVRKGPGGCWVYGSKGNEKVIPEGTRVVIVKAP